LSSRRQDAGAPRLFRTKSPLRVLGVPFQLERHTNLGYDARNNLSMFQRLGSFFGDKPPQRGAPLIPEAPSSVSPLQRAPVDRRPTYSKIFRWRMPDGQTAAPKTVEVAGSFNHWQKVPLVRDGVLDAW